MFRKPSPSSTTPVTPTERVTSVLGPGLTWSGSLRGSGGVRIEGVFEGEINVRGLVVIGESGKVTCEELRANSVVVAGTLRGNILAEKLEIRSTGRVWGDVTVVSFSTEEGAFLRGAVRMEDKVDLQFESPEPPAAADAPTGEAGANA